MTVEELIQEVHQYGGRLSPDGDRVKVRAPKPLPDDLMAELRANRDALRELIAQGRDVDALLAEACEGLDVTPEDLRGDMDEQDLEDVRSGAIDRDALRAYAVALNGQSLAAKLRAYGEPLPVIAHGKRLCWLVADEAAAAETQKPEPVYTAAEVERMGRMPADDARALHELKNVFGGHVEGGAA